MEKKGFNGFLLFAIRQWWITSRLIDSLCRWCWWCWWQTYISLQNYIRGVSIVFGFKGFEFIWRGLSILSRQWIRLKDESFICPLSMPRLHFILHYRINGKFPINLVNSINRFIDNFSILFSLLFSLLYLFKRMHTFDHLWKLFKWFAVELYICILVRIVY